MDFFTTPVGSETDITDDDQEYQPRRQMRSKHKQQKQRKHMDSSYPSTAQLIAEEMGLTRLFQILPTRQPRRKTPLAPPPPVPAPAPSVDPLYDENGCRKVVFPVLKPRPIVKVTGLPRSLEEWESRAEYSDLSLRFKQLQPFTPPLPPSPPVEPSRLWMIPTLPPAPLSLEEQITALCDLPTPPDSPRSSMAGSSVTAEEWNRQYQPIPEILRGNGDGYIGVTSERAEFPLDELWPAYLGQQKCIQRIDEWSTWTEETTMRNVYGPVNNQWNPVGYQLTTEFLTGLPPHNGALYHRIMLHWEDWGIGQFTIELFLDFTLLRWKRAYLVSYTKPTLS